MSLRSTLSAWLTGSGIVATAEDVSVVAEETAGRLHVGRYDIITDAVAVRVEVRLRHDAQGQARKGGVEVLRELGSADRIERQVAWLRAAFQSGGLAALGSTMSEIDATLDSLMTAYTGESATNSRRIAQILTLRDAGILARDGDAVVIVGGS